MWYYMLAGERIGPIPAQEIPSAIAAGKLTPLSPVWKSGMADWAPAGGVPELTPLFPANAQASFTAAVGFTPANNTVPDYMVWAILELLLLCMPFGVVGLIYAVQANAAKAAGRIAEAQQGAATAKKWLTVGLVLGVLFWLVWIAYMLFILVMAIIGAAS